MALRTSQATLLSLGLLGIYSLHIFSRQTGFWGLMESLAEKSRLPNGKDSIPASFTGVEAVDNFLKLLVVFFWPTVDGSHPALSLKCFLFVFQSVAMLTVTLLEGVRNGNKNRVVSVTTVYFFLLQTCGLAVIGPLYLLLHLFTSATVSNPTPFNLSADEGFITGIPFGIAVGFIAPTIWMALPSPNVIELDQKILGILFWQGSPIYAGLYASIWQTVLWPKIQYANEAQARKNQILLLRYVYKFGLALAAIAHIATMTLTISAYLLPSLFSPSIVGLIQPQHVLMPPNPFDSSVRVASVAEGSMHFIQFDYYISATAYLIWAHTLRYAGLNELFDLEAIIGLLTRTVLLGPMAAALTYVWDRDEVVFSEGGKLAVPDSIKKIL